MVTHAAVWTVKQLIGLLALPLTDLFMFSYPESEWESNLSHVAFIHT